ncbi:hypothetical protein QBC38DRAFT_468653 [Podospora fimiseda]|uniref:Uncharacterized protein n=1 Tax=Podospora fimiseda TaxID=252190 RepID=A0AAN7BXF4_9PEZI|nr:hypothetical protein QBC38DRAFT_468653 [Podospora fimiseda]
MRPNSTRLSSVCIALSTSILGLISPTLATTTSSTRSSQPQPQPTSNTNNAGVVLPFFLPDSEPLSLVASVVVINQITQTTSILKSTSKPPSTKPTVSTTLIPSTTRSSNPSEITFQIDCATAASPENDACRSASIYPAQVTQKLLSPGAEWRGVTSYLIGDDSTTTWTCWQGMTMKPEVMIDEMLPYAECVSTIVKSEGSSIRYTTNKYDECYLYRHMLPLIVTAGQGDVTGEWAKHMTAGGDVGKMNSGWENKMKRLGCDMQGTRTMWAGSVKTKERALATATGTADGKTQSSGAATERPRIWNGVVAAGISVLLIGFVGFESII